MPDEQPRLGWWAISGEALMAMLRRCANGEDPDLVYTEFLVDAQPAKHCTKCRRVMSLALFRIARGRPESWCRRCRRIAIEDWQGRHPEERAATQRRAQLKRKYGITEADYDKMFATQGGVCACCRQLETRMVRGYGKEKIARLSVDHDHITGRIRGLLCRDCNKAIGLASDSPALLRRLADYIEEYANSSHEYPEGGSL